MSSRLFRKMKKKKKNLFFCMKMNRMVVFDNLSKEDYYF